MKKTGFIRKIMAAALCAVMAAGTLAAVPSVSAYAAAPSVTQSSVSSSKLTISKTSYQMYETKTFTLSAKGASNIRFSSSDTKIVKIVSQKNGSCKIKALKAGTATVKAVSGSKTASCKITVKPYLSHDFTSKSVFSGDSFELTATTAGKAGKCTFTADNNNVMLIKNADNKVLVKAFRQGKTKITVKAENGRTKTCIVNIYGLTLNTNKLYYKNGQLCADCTIYNSSKKPVTITSASVLLSTNQGKTIIAHQTFFNIKKAVLAEGSTHWTITFDKGCFNSDLDLSKIKNYNAQFSYTFSYPK